MVSVSSSHRVSHASVRRWVTLLRSGPILSPLPIVWHMAHLALKAIWPFSASGSLAAADSGWGCAAAWSVPELSDALTTPTAPSAALAKWWSTMMYSPDRKSVG